jgi:ketosteroid isomerase-like protein
MSSGPARPDHESAVVYRRAADAFRRKDLPTLAETIHEDVAWHFPGTSWMAREIEGREGLLAFLKELMVRTSGTFTLEDVAVHGSDHHVIAIQRFGATHSGERRAFDASSVMRFEGGRQIERWFYLHDQEGFDAFFARFGDVASS